MKINKVYVLHMLESYRDMARQAAQLAFEIQNYLPNATDTDIIDTMTFGQSTGIVSKGRVSNKTEVIALSYSERKEALNIKELRDLQNDLQTVSTQMSRLRYYISLLDKRQAEILTLVYVDGVLPVDAAGQLGFARSTLYRNRDTAIDILTEMLQRISSN